MVSETLNQGPPPQDQNAVPRASQPSFFPFHIVPGIFNFRDVGGWPIASSTAFPRHVRTGLLYRGSDTNCVTPKGEARLKELNIKVDFDLRSKQQIQKTGGYRDIEGIQRLWTPVFAEEAYTEEAARQRYEQYARDGTDGIVTAFIEILIAGADMFRTVVTRLISMVDAHPSPPALFMHCTTGNNRTGVFVSLLLLLLRVPVALVVKEYVLSEQGLAPTRHINIDRLLRKGAFNHYGPEEASRKCERMVGARPQSMEALVEEVERKWGGAEGYFRDVVGLRDQDMERLREIFTLEGEAEMGMLFE